MFCFIPAGAPGDLTGVTGVLSPGCHIQRNHFPPKRVDSLAALYALTYTTISLFKTSVSTLSFVIYAVYIDVII